MAGLDPRWPGALMSMASGRSQSSTRPASNRTSSASTTFADVTANVPSPRCMRPTLSCRASAKLQPLVPLCATRSVSNKMFGWDAELRHKRSFAAVGPSCPLFLRLQRRQSKWRIEKLLHRPLIGRVCVRTREPSWGRFLPPPGSRQEQSVGRLSKRSLASPPRTGRDQTGSRTALVRRSRILPGHRRLLSRRF